MSTTRPQFPDVVIRASAGTGKTFQLSNRFIGLTSLGEPPETILATTFTRKAAGEILDRVLSRLAEAALDAKKLSELARHLDDSSLDRPRCLDLLCNMVRRLHRLRVSTLDSFFIQVAQSFSLELGLPPGWQIVDEIVDRRLRAEAVRTVLQDESTRDTVRLMHLLTKGEASRSVAEQIGSLVRELYSLYLDAPAEAWQSLPRPKPLNPLEQQAALEALAAVELPAGKRYPKTRGQDLDAAIREDWETFVRRGIGAKIVDGTELFYGKPVPAEVLAAYRPLVDHAKAVLVGQIANQTDATRQLLERFDLAYGRLKVSRHALRFEDVTRGLGGALIGRRMDEVVYRLDARVAHLLLDEFQDTSPQQWRVLRPFAKRVTGGGRRQSFFCVGDVKQAIYGWRGGVAEIFEALDDELQRLTPESLNQSWRSAQPVIDTVNLVFEGLAGNTVMQRYPAAAEKWSQRFATHTTARGELPGYCQMQFGPRAPEASDQRTVTLQFAAEQIAQLHRRDPGRRIGVLVRRNDAVARLIYELRHNHHVEASEEGGNPLTDSPAVQVVLSLLTLADHPGDTASRFHVAHSPLAEAVGFTQWDDSASAGRLAHRIRRRLMSDGYGPTLDDWAGRLEGNCGRRDLSRLAQLVAAAYAYEPAATTRPGDFVELVSHQRVDDPTASAVRVMTVFQAKGLQFEVVVLPELDSRLTGQPPRMVVARPRPTGDVTHVCRWVSKEIRALLPVEFGRMFEAYQCQAVEESLCVLYVALTRAVNALHVIVAPPREREKTLPATPAGLLRAALCDDGPAEPSTVAFEHGDERWFERPAEAEPAGEIDRSGVEPLVVRLAESPKRPGRGLERRSPSALEGGSRVDLAGRMRLDTSVALDRGTLMHAWYELIEWLEDGPPDDDALRRVADSLAAGRLDVSAQIEQFRRSLAQPAIRAALSRATYERPDDGQSGCAIHARADIKQPRWEVWRERPFAVRDDDAILRGAIDRMVVLYDVDRPIAADVLDYKTDTVAADDEDALAARVEEYRPQLEAYRRAVAGMTGLEPSLISTRLAFVGPGVVRPVL